MNFQEKASNLILSLNLKGQTAKQASAALGIEGKNEIKEIKKVLDALVSDGKLIKDERGKYFGQATRIKPEVNVKKVIKDTVDASGYKDGGDIYATATKKIDLKKAVIYDKKGKTQPIYVGTLRGNKRGFAFLIRDDGGNDLFIPNSQMNGAQHGDRVACTIVEGDSARVELIIDRGSARLVGRLVRRDGDYFGFVIPDNNAWFSDIKVLNRDLLNAKHNDKVVVEINEYNKTKLRGKVVEVIGSADDKESAVLSILKSYEFYNEFPASAIKEAESFRYTESGKRIDYRDKLTITIDGDDSKDFDDAVSLEKKGGEYYLYVHIADVSHYVAPDSELDKEAFKRCTSVYFPGSVYPMLPSVLSNDLCSLVEGADRLTLTCAIHLDSSGSVIDSKIEESIINSDRRMTYNNVTEILNGNEKLHKEYAQIAPMLFEMRELSEKLEKRRINRGKIDLVSKECKILLDDNGDVTDIVEYPYTISNGIIEEFMLLANERVAEFAVKNEIPFVYRVHESPDKDKIRALRLFLGGLGLMLPPGDVQPEDIRELLKQLEGKDIEGVVNRVVLRSMQKAKYMTECKGHFGLATTYYCHFTSPIRRYPDLQIHRVLKAYLNGKSVAKSKFMVNKCAETASKSSEREVAAERAERDIDDFYKAEYMAKHIGETFDGIISGVTSFGIFVELKNTCEGIIKLDGLPADNYNYIEDRFLLKGVYNSYGLGERMRIRVKDVDRTMNRVIFEPVSGNDQIADVL